jgi:hypothetical protein
MSLGIVISEFSCFYQNAINYVTQIKIISITPKFILVQVVLSFCYSLIYRVYKSFNLHGIIVTEITVAQSRKSQRRGNYNNLIKTVKDEFRYFFEQLGIFFKLFTIDGISKVTI